MYGATQDGTGSGMFANLTIGFLLTDEYMHESTDNMPAFPIADLICRRLDLEGQAYSREAYKQLQESQGVVRG